MQGAAFPDWGDNGNAIIGIYQSYGENK